MGFSNNRRVSNINDVWEDVTVAADMVIAEAKASCNYEQCERLLAIATRLTKAMRRLNDMLMIEADEFKKETQRLFEIETK